MTSGTLTLAIVGCLIVSFSGPSFGLANIQKMMTPEEAFGPDMKDALRGTPQDCIPIPPDHHRCGEALEECIAANGIACPEAKRVKCETKAKNTQCFCNGKGLNPSFYTLVLMNLHVCDKTWYTNWYKKRLAWDKAHPANGKPMQESGWYTH